MQNRDDIFGADMLYNGDGGISKVYFGSSLELHQNLSVGANASYLFGGLNRRKKLEFDDETIFNSRSNSLINIKGIVMNLAQFFQKKSKIIIPKFLFL